MEEKKSNDSVRIYFWMVHYDVSPVTPADGLTPIAAGRKRGIYVYARNIHSNHMFDFRMPRENEGATPDPKTYRGSADFRNRIVGFYSSEDEANVHLDAIWTEIQAKCGAIYAELHSLRLDVAQQLKLVA
jgi:hypothetical protein